MIKGVIVIMFITAACWIATLFFLFWRDHLQWKRIYDLLQESRADRKELIDRLMARDFAQYKQAELIAQHLAQQPQDVEVEPDDFDLSDVGA